MGFWNSVGGALVDWVTSDNSDSSLSTTQGAMNRAASARIYETEQMGATKFSSKQAPQIMTDTLRQAAKMNSFSISEADLAANLIRESISPKQGRAGSVSSGGVSAGRTKGSLVGKGLGQKDFA